MKNNATTLGGDIHTDSELEPWPARICSYRYDRGLPRLPALYMENSVIQKLQYHLMSD